MSNYSGLGTKKTAVDDYVFDVLMRDLTGHDRATPAFLVYLHLWRESRGRIGSAVRASHSQMAEAVGLSKSAVQGGVRRLIRRGLLRVHKTAVTAVPEYRVLRPWRR